MLLLLPMLYYFYKYENPIHNYDYPETLIWILYNVYLHATCYQFALINIYDHLLFILVR